MRLMTGTAYTPQGAFQGPNDSPDFAALLTLVGQSGDRDAFIALFEYFAPRVKSFLIKSGAKEETADELAQETMLTVWDKAESYNPDKAAPSTWIFTIARNKRIDALRKASNSNETTTDNLIIEDDRPSQSQTLSEAEEAQILEEALKSLPPEQADLIRKSFFEDKTHAEISEETGLPLGTVKSRIRLALERLRSLNAVKGLWS